MKRLTPIAWLLLSLAVACGKDADLLPPQIERTPEAPTRLADLPSGIFSLFKDINQLEPEVQRAARAVVKIERQDGVIGSGAFVTSSQWADREGPLLLTNAHVLGNGSCTKQGCVVRLHFWHEHDPSEPPLSAWFTLMPIALSSDIDASAFSVFENRNMTRPYNHPHSLSLDEPSNTKPPNQRSIRKQDMVYLIGFPLGYLKKALPGAAIGETQPFRSSEILALPGTSGGPIVDSNGTFLALHHRGTQNAEYLRNTGYFGVSLSTTRAAIRNLLLAVNREDSLSSLAISDPDPHDADTWLSLGSALTAQADASAPAFDTDPAGVVGRRAEIFWSHCSASSLDACAAAERLVACRTPQSVHPLTPLQEERLSSFEEATVRSDQEQRMPPRFCPVGERSQLWIERFLSLADLFDSESDLYLRVQKMLELLPPQTSRAELSRDRNSLFVSWYQNAGKQKRVTDAVHALDVTGQALLDDQDTSFWFIDFRSIKDYYYQYSNFLRGAYLLARSGHLKLQEASPLLQLTRTDPSATVSDFLLADFLLWRLQHMPAGEGSPSPFSQP